MNGVDTVPRNNTRNRPDRVRHYRRPFLWSVPFYLAICQRGILAIARSCFWLWVFVWSLLRIHEPADAGGAKHDPTRPAPGLSPTPPPTRITTKVGQTMYVVEKLFDLTGGFISKSVAVFSREDLAQAYIMSRSEESRERYRIVEHELDECPDDDEKLIPDDIFREMFQNHIDDTLQDLMNSGEVDQLVGEDGHFYYKLTPKGEETAKRIIDENYPNSDETP